MQATVITGTFADKLNAASSSYFKNGMEHACIQVYTYTHTHGSAKKNVWTVVIGLGIFPLGHWQTGQFSTFPNMHVGLLNIWIYV